ncbi:TPA: hypothetical protein SMI27_005282, partial [Serratia liquefaciens]|nr:hypothetical protein [Serratia liquefaciens]
MVLRLVRRSLLRRKTVFPVRHRDLQHPGGKRAGELRLSYPAAIDHYPQLAVFRFSLLQPDADTLFLSAESVLKFVYTFQRMTNEFIDMRHCEDKAAPPTTLRVLWGINTSHDLQMLLLLNHSTFGGGSWQEQPEAVLVLIRQARATVTATLSMVTSGKSAGLLFVVPRSTPAAQALPTQSMAVPGLIPRVTGNQSSVLLCSWCCRHLLTKN